MAPLKDTGIRPIRPARSVLFEMEASREVRSASMDRKAWSIDSHERAVENFYSAGAENFGDFHGGYLNFGLWEDGNEDYVTAAENLVMRIGALLGLDSNSHLLDVAPGMGSQDVLLYRKFGSPRIDALDATWKHVEHGRRRAREH